MFPVAETDLDRTERMLVALCRRDAVTTLRAVELEPLVQGPFRTELRNLAATHRVTGLILRALQQLASSGQLSQEILKSLYAAAETREGVKRPGSRDRERSFEDLLARQRERDQELAHLLGLLHAEQLDPVVLKGPVLGCVAYAESVERRYSDFDLLFRAEEIDRALGLAEADGYVFPFSPGKLAGYRTLHIHVLLRKAPHMRAEIHWDLCGPRALFRLDANAFRRRSVHVTGPSRISMRVPCAEHLLLHSAYDNLRDTFSRFGRIVDIDRIVAAAPDLDWDYAVSQARVGEMPVLLALSLELSRTLLGTPVPAEVLRDLRPDAAARFHLRLARIGSFVVREHYSAFHDLILVWCGANWRNRGRQLFRLVSGEQFANLWIFRDEDTGPPGRHVALWAGMKMGLKLVAYHGLLYLRGIAFWVRGRRAGSGQA